MDHLQLMRHDIYYDYCVAMTYKTWPLKGIADEAILRIAQSGIQHYWELTSVNKYESSKIQLRIKTSRRRDTVGPISLELKHAVGFFVIWAFGLVLAFVVFVVELIVSKMTRKSNLFEFAN